MTVDVAAQEFEAHRRFVWGLAYRMTGDAAEADDVVQETFLRALQHAPASREDGWRGWLARVAANLSIDALRRRKRREYIGPWLPAPVETGDEAAAPGFEIASGEMTTEGRYDLVESVSMAFLLALERLTPRQRAVLLLRDVFDYSVQETAAALQMTASNVKVTHHRARAAMEAYDRRRVVPTRPQQAAAAEKLSLFLKHLEDHDVPALEAMLADDVRFLADSGGEYPSSRQPVYGRDNVTRLLFGLAAKRKIAAVRFTTLNGAPAVIARTDVPEGWAPRFVFRLDFDPDGRIREVHTIISSRKLAAVPSA